MSNQVMSGRQMDIEEFKHRIKKIFENVAIDNFSRDTIIKKINKLLDILIKLPEYDDDYKIVTQMKEEYTNDKKIYSSTLMYLNKLYKQTKQKE